MHNTLVKMKDGAVYCGPLWEFRPKEGWLSIVDEDAPDRIHLRDVETAVTKGERISVSKVGDHDLVKQAREDGWDGT